MQVQAPKYNGYPTIASLATGLGSLGRYEDTYMVHAAEGETVVPAEVLAANPELKQHLFWQMRMMGIKDPNRYVVGNTMNSINPVTGQPEFWFKKIKNFAKKVFKKALPVIAPIVGNLIAPGIGGIIASGLVTKLQGGSWGDVLKSSALSYGIGALGQGVSGAFGAGSLAEAPGAFAKSFGAGLSAPWSAAKGLLAGTPLSSAPATLNPLAQGIFGPTGLNAAFPVGAAALKQVPKQTAFGSETLGKIFPTYQTGAQLQEYGINPQTGQYDVQGMMGKSVVGPGGREYIQTQTEAGTRVQLSTGESVIVPQSYADSVPIDANTGLPSASADAGLRQASTNYMATGTSGGAPSQTTLQQGAQIPEGYELSYEGVEVGGTPKLKLVDAPDPTFWQGAKEFGLRTAEKAIVPGIMAGLAYLDAEKPEENPEGTREQLAGEANRLAYDDWLALPPDQQYSEQGIILLRKAGIRPTGQSVEKLAEITGTTVEQAQAYLDRYYGPQTSTPSPETEVASLAIEPPTIPDIGIAIGSPEFNAGLPPELQPGVIAARGGIVSLQGGGEITGPGSGTSDSIPARLSDGEFVMTANAVRGIGNGNRDLGAARMYDLMSRYERTA